MMIFVDTNYFVRFLLADIPHQYKEAEILFTQGASGEVVLTTSAIVIFELHWVFKSIYKKPKAELIEILKKVLAMDFIAIEDKATLKDSLVLYAKTNIEFVDCYNLAFARSKSIKEFKTFDKKLEKQWAT